MKPMSVMAAAVLLLSACGGGGGGTSSQPPNPAGIYLGEFYASPTSAADGLFAIVDENGSAAMFLVDGSVTSSLQFKTVYRLTLPKAANFSVSYREYPRPGSSGSARSGIMNGDISTRDAIDGSFGAGAASPVFLLNYSPAYETPVPFSTVQGVYQYSLPSSGAALTVQLTVDALGRITGNDGACSYSGFLSLPNAAFNAYNVSLSRTCGATTVAYTGLADYAAASGSRPAFLLIEYDDGANFGLGVVAIKQ